MWRAIFTQRDRLAVENDVARANRSDGLHHLRYGVRDVAKRPRIDADLVANFVGLHARPIQLEFERRLAEFPDGGVDVWGRFGEHRLNGPEGRQREAFESNGALSERLPRDGGERPLEHHGASNQISSDA